MEKLSAGGTVAMISDAGTPLISDPGYKLVRDCFELGFFVTSLPGANAPLTALQLSGLPSHSFSFLGFLPPKQAARQKMLREWAQTPGTLVIYETGPRLLAALEDMLDVLGDRKAAVIREMTKMYEESLRDTLSSLFENYEKSGPPKGEIVVVIEGATQRQFSQKELIVELFEAMNTMGLKEASSHVAEKTGRSKKELYELALSIKKT
jgi:16S rRNA (cytidine1402-2'-O)-methyltransferase